MQLGYFLMFAALASGAWASVYVLPCPDTSAFVKEVKLVGEDNGECNTSESKEPCKLSPGETGHLEMSYDSYGDVETLTEKVKATVEGVTTGYPLQDADKGCEHSDTFCPWSTGDPVTTKMSLKLPGLLPHVPVKLEFSLLNQLNEVVSCFIMQAQIVKKP